MWVTFCPRLAFLILICKPFVMEGELLYVTWGLTPAGHKS